jgi:lipoteichoic acid synthase
MNQDATTNKRSDEDDLAKTRVFHIHREALESPPQEDFTSGSADDTQQETQEPIADLTEDSVEDPAVETEAEVETIETDPVDEEAEEIEEDILSQEPIPEDVSLRPFLAKLWKRIKKALPVLFLPLVFLYSETVLRCFSSSTPFQNYAYPFFFSIAVGLLISGILTQLPPKANKIATMVILYLNSLLFTVECIVKNSFQVYMELGSILAGTDGVVNGYSDSVISSILHGIPKILLFFAPSVLYTIFGRKWLIVPKKRWNWLPSVITVGCACVVFVTTVAVTNSSSNKDKYKAQFHFDSATETFGLLTSFRLSAHYNLFGNAQATSFVLEADAPVETTEATTETTVATTLYDTQDPFCYWMENEEETEEEPVITGDNVMDIDFDQISQENGSSTIDSLNEYVQSLTPTNKNKYTGLFEGKNLILICAEAFSDVVIDKDLTPTLYRMSHNGIYFSNYYQPTWGGSTSTGEYSFVTGLVPMNGIQSILDIRENNNYFTLGNQLQALGYTSCAYHNGSYDFYDRDLTHTHLGYDQYLATGNGLEDIVGYDYPSDTDMFDATMDTYIDNQPFSMYYMTVSGHCIYSSGNEKVTKYLDKVLDVYGDKYKDTTNYYLCYQLELENALTTIIDKLEEAGIADDTVICMTADHYPYGLEISDTFGNSEDYVTDLYGYEYSAPWEQDHNTWILWSGCLENEDESYSCEISDPTYSLDIVPTLLNLFGLEYDSRLLVGRDVFSDAEPLILWNNYSWMTDQGRYNARNGEFTANDGCDVDDAYIERISNAVANKMNFSSQVVSSDYYGVLFGPDLYQ